MNRSAFGIAVAVAASAAVVLFAGSGDDPLPAGRSGPRIPVLLVHGSGLGSTSWQALIDHLGRSGWPREYLMAVDLVPDDGANIAAAESQLRPAARRLLDQAAAKARLESWPVPEKLAVIGHSMGAISGRWLAAKILPARTAAFISIAGANHGTAAVCGLPGQGNDEMCPPYPGAGESIVLEQLNGTREQPLDETPYGAVADPAGVPAARPRAGICIAWYAIFMDPDEWIVPADSARLGGAGGGPSREPPSGIERVAPGEFRLNDRVRHDDLPAAPAVMEFVAAILSSEIICDPI